MRYHFPNSRIAIIKKKIKPKIVLAVMWGNLNTGALLVEMYDGTAAMENSMTSPQIIKNKIAP
jgi:hypothetical protein